MTGSRRAGHRAPTKAPRRVFYTSPLRTWSPTPEFGASGCALEISSCWGASTAGEGQFAWTTGSASRGDRAARRLAVIGGEIRGSLVPPCRWPRAPFERFIMVYVKAMMSCHQTTKMGTQLLISTVHHQRESLTCLSTFVSRHKTPWSPLHASFSERSLTSLSIGVFPCRRRCWSQYPISNTGITSTDQTCLPRK